MWLQPLSMLQLPQHHQSLRWVTWLQTEWWQDALLQPQWRLQW